MSTKAFFITLITIAIGALVINSFNHQGNITSASNANAVTQSETDNLTSTDIPSNTPDPLEKCDFGIAVRNIAPDKCKEVQDIINQNKTRDKAAVQQKIDSLNQKVKFYEDDIQKANSNYTSCVNNYPPNPTDYQSIMGVLNCASIKQSVQGLDQGSINNIDSQIQTYSNYLTNIDYGIGNGACSGHDGVNPAAGKGNFGQVICNDDWTGSSVYYYNVIEDIDYLLTSLN